MFETNHKDNRIRFGVINVTFDLFDNLPGFYLENIQIHISKLFILKWLNLKRISFRKELLCQRKDENENLEIQLFQINSGTLVILIFVDY